MAQKSKLRIKTMRHFVLAAAAMVFSANAFAEFRSIGENATIFYDAPSTRASKLFVVSRDLPVEIITTDATWTKVRDSSGSLAWVEKKALSEKRTVLVTAPIAQVRERADEQAPLLFQLQQGVVADLLDSGGGWARIQHADGSTGYLRIQQVWGL
ncbi:MAG TPA: SH3 domain-containing protein [Burkholderiales bacterium]|nr:SH3 domain-containing protein [Burkholderiales bacterium]